MTVSIVSGDLFEADSMYFVNAVNCSGVMGGGIARQFALRNHEYFEDYRKKCNTGNMNLGKVDIYHNIVSFPTMRFPGVNSCAIDIHLGLEDLRLHLLEVLNKKPANTFVIEVAMPALGCGVGGMDFRHIIHMVDMVFGPEPRIHVDLYAPFIS